MAFTLPTFNLSVNIWRWQATTPPVGPPDVSTVGNLAWGKRTNSPNAIMGPGVIVWGALTLLLPALTDIRGPQAAAGSDLVEVPAGSGRFYYVLFTDDIGKGFANEHRAAVLFQDQSSTWPFPTP